MTNPDPFEDYSPLQSFIDRAVPPAGSYSEAEIVDPLPLQSFVDDLSEKRDSPARPPSGFASEPPSASARLESMEKFLSALSQIESVVIFVGDVLIVKAAIAGKPRIAIETISPTLRGALEANPALLRSPEKLLAEVEERLYQRMG